MPEHIPTGLTDRQLLEHMFSQQNNFQNEVKKDIKCIHEKVDTINTRTSVMESGCALKHDAVNKEIEDVRKECLGVKDECSKIENRVDKKIAIFQWGIGFIVSLAAVVGGAITTMIGK